MVEQIFILFAIIVSTVFTLWALVMNMKVSKIVSEKKDRRKRFR